jgi:hypothetical protein
MYIITGKNEDIRIEHVPQKRMGARREGARIWANEGGSGIPG